MSDSRNSEKPRGALFKVKEKKTSKAPDYSGLITISEDQARDIYNRARETGEVKLQLSGWIKEPGENSKSKDRYISLAGDFGVGRDSRDSRGGGGRDSRDSRDDRDTRRREPAKKDDRDFDDEIPF